MYLVPIWSTNHPRFTYHHLLIKCVPLDPAVNQNTKMVSLYIKTETCRQIEPPKYGEDVSSLTLGTLGKNLSVYEFDNTHANLWIMKTCSGEESWTKLFTIPYIDEPTLLSRGYMNKVVISKTHLYFCEWRHYYYVELTCTTIQSEEQHIQRIAWCGTRMVIWCGYLCREPSFTLV